MKDINIGVMAIVLFSGLFGMWYHWRTAKRRGDVSGTFYSYLVADNPMHTGTTLTMFLMAMGGLFSVGSFDAVQIDAFVEALSNGYLYSPMVSAVAVATTTGYACDSRFNKG